MIAGGREPPQWEAYPHHQFLHTVGALPCCEKGGCWKARTLPLGDGSEKDLPRNLCLNVVQGMPRCMHMISAEDVIRGVQMYFVGGRLAWLTEQDFCAAQPTVRQPIAHSQVATLTTMRRVILKCDHSASTTVMLTAAVRDLHASCPVSFRQTYVLATPSYGATTPTLAVLICAIRTLSRSIAILAYSAE